MSSLKVGDDTLGFRTIDAVDRQALVRLKIHYCAAGLRPKISIYGQDLPMETQRCWRA